MGRPKKEAAVSGIAVKDFKPYTGRDCLPDYVVVREAEGKKQAVIQFGEPRFSVARGDRRTYKILCFFKSPSGVERRLYGVLKPTNKRPKDKELFEKLKAAGIPGAI